MKQKDPPRPDKIQNILHDIPIDWEVTSWAQGLQPLESSNLYWNKVASFVEEINSADSISAPIKATDFGI